MLERIEQLLVAVDFSDVTVRVVDEAGHLAKALGAKILLVHVEDTEKTMLGFDAGSEEERALLDQQPGGPLSFLAPHEDRLRANGVEVASRIERGDPVEELVKIVEQVSATLMVIGTHGHGSLYHLIAGSVGEGVLKRSPCPVLVIRSELDVV